MRTPFASMTVAAAMAAAFGIASPAAQARPHWSSETQVAPGSITTSIAVRSPVLELIMSDPRGRAFVNRKLEKATRKLTRWGTRHGLGAVSGGNSASLVQSGDNNSAALGQSGAMHDAQLTQTGSSSALGVVQFGCGGTVAPVQAVDGEIRFVLQAAARC